MVNPNAQTKLVISLWQTAKCQDAITESAVCRVTRSKKMFLPKDNWKPAQMEWKYINFFPLSSQSQLLESHKNKGFCNTHDYVVIPAFSKGFAADLSFSEEEEKYVVELTFSIWWYRTGGLWRVQYQPCSNTYTCSF